MTNPIHEDWGARRRAAAWINVIVQTAVLLGLLVMVNLLARKHPVRFDLTARREYALSNIATDLLNGLDFDLTIWVNSNAYGAADKSLGIAYDRTLKILEEFKKRSARVKVLEIRGDVPEKTLWQKHWSVVTPSSVFLLATRADGQTNKKIVEIRELYEGDATSGEVFSYRGEPVLVQSIRDIAGRSKRIFYETDGHQEIVSADPRLGVLRQFLTLNEGIDLRRLTLNDYKRIPDDCQVLLIMAPAQPFVQHELDILREYLDRGGSLLVTARPRVRTGLEFLLEEYGARVGDNLVCDYKQSDLPFISRLTVREFNIHEVNRTMVGLTLRIPDSCTVDAIDKKNPAWKIVPLAMAGPESWEEKGEIRPGANPKPDSDERRGNMKLIVAVDKPAAHDSKKRTRLIVWGSAGTFTNAVLQPAGLLQQVELNYIVNQLRWLSDRGLMEIEPKRIAVKPLEMSASALNQVWWVVVAGFPLFAVSLGILVWFLRRK